MKYIVFSDSHGSLRYMETALEKETFDGIIHLGDGYEDSGTVESFYPEKAVIRLSGNCDLFCGAPSERIARTDGVTFFLCHGHRYGVKDGYYNLRSHARDIRARAALFGHTHVPYLDEDDGILLLNPGSVARGDYAVIEFRDGKVRAALKSVD